MDRVQLREFLITHFNDNELRDLCFSLAIDYENLPGAGKADKARELVAYCERFGRTDELVEACRRLRPNVFAETVPPVVSLESSASTSQPGPGMDRAQPGRSFAGYADFDLEITCLGESRYCARVLDSPAGQSSVEFARPFSDLELENFILKIGRTRTGVRRLESPEMRAAEAFGRKLFESVFHDELRECLTSSLHQVDRQEIPGLRIKLRLVDVPELANLPWEYLYHPTLRRFIVLSVETPITRYTDLPRPITPLKVETPLLLLVAAASPNDFASLDVEREKAKMTSALRDLEARGVIAVEWLEQATLAALQQRLRKGPVHLFHFIGHGGWDDQAEDGVLLFENEQRRGAQVSASRLATILHDHRTLRLVVLNACEGARVASTDPFAGVAATLVQQGIPAVVAMQFEITDHAAILFSQVFYDSLADGYSVEAALAEARKAIFASGNDVEWGTPVLYLRAASGRLFDFVVQPSQVVSRASAPQAVQTPSSRQDDPRQAASSDRRQEKPSPRAHDQGTPFTDLFQQYFGQITSPAAADVRSTKGGVPLNATISIETLGGVATPILPKGIGLPAEAKRIFSTAVDSQPSVEVHLVYGDNEMVSDNSSLGKFILDSIPPSPKGIPQIEVQFRVDIDHRLNVTAVDKSTGRNKGFGPVDLRSIESPRRGSDVRSDLMITLEEAVLGTEKTVEVTTMGKGRKLHVRIPAGVDTGTQVRLTGEGESGEMGGSAGDLYLVITVSGHPLFTRVKDDIKIRIPLRENFLRAGGRIRVPKVGSGFFEVEISPKTSQDKTIRLRGQGVEHLRRQGRGDFLILLQAYNPRSMSSEVQRHIQLIKHALGGLDIEAD